ncbi:MAG TPA: hypothetical protein PLG90_03125 [Ignavibacteria bacterium]|nr:hypothetical protein [Ignavibacteria bacterium]
MSVKELLHIIEKNSSALSEEQINKIAEFIYLVKSGNEPNIDIYLKNLNSFEQTHLENEFLNYKEKYPVE